MEEDKKVEVELDVQKEQVKKEFTGFFSSVKSFSKRSLGN